MYPSFTFVIHDDIKKELLTILSTGEYCIPFETEFFEEFKGKIGKIKIKWTTQLSATNVIPVSSDATLSAPYTHEEIIPI